jgi:hypothetical protein
MPQMCHALSRKIAFDKPSCACVFRSILLSLLPFRARAKHNGDMCDGSGKHSEIKTSHCPLLHRRSIPHSEPKWATQALLLTAPKGRLCPSAKGSEILLLRRHQILSIGLSAGSESPLHPTYAELVRLRCSLIDRMSTILMDSRVQKESK